MFIEDTTPIAALTVADIKKLLKDSIREQKIEAIPPVTSPSIARLRRLWSSATDPPVLFRSTVEWNRRNS